MIQVGDTEIRSIFMNEKTEALSESLIDIYNKQSKLNSNDTYTDHSDEYCEYYNDWVYVDS